MKFEILQIIQSSSNSLADINQFYVYELLEVGFRNRGKWLSNK